MFKEKLKSKCFWTAIAGIIIILLQGFGVRFNVPILNEAIASVGALLVFLGVIIPNRPKDDEMKSDEMNNE